MVTDERAPWTAYLQEDEPDGGDIRSFHCIRAKGYQLLDKNSNHGMNVRSRVRSNKRCLRHVTAFDRRRDARADELLRGEG